MLLSLLKRAWNHKFFVSVAFSDTSAARGIYIRAFWPLFASFCIVMFSGFMFFIGETARAQLAARVAGDEEASKYLARILEMEENSQIQAQQMDVLARELGTLQSRLERFDVIGEKLVSDAELSELITSKDLEYPDGAKGGPDTGGILKKYDDLSELNIWMDDLRTKADRAQLALETGLALSLMRQETEAGMPSHFPVLHPTMRITSGYGWRVHPITKRRHLHEGVDVGAPRGGAIVAAADGIVVYTGYRYAYGIVVEVRHANGYSTRYAHLNKTTVNNGDQVNAGDLIGLVGSTGRSTGPHLHFELLQGDEKLNPWPFIRQHYKSARDLAKTGLGAELIANWKSREASKKAAAAKKLEQAAYSG